jgi:uncharacterized protein (TIGR04168 family)
MIIRIMGDPHGNLDLEEDGYWLSQADLALCTGDFAYHITGRDRDLSVKAMRALNDFKVFTILGNHDGINHRPSMNYGPAEAEPGCQTQMVEALGEYYMGYRRVDFEEFSLVGGRPFSNGNPGIKHKPLGHEDITVEESAQKILTLIKEAPNKNILLLSHNGPKGLGSERDSICGRDWRKPTDDWGDEDLALALESLPEDKKIMAIVMGHMHHHLMGGGYRRRMDFAKDIPVVNAAVVPRIIKKGVLVSRNFAGEIKEKKVFQPHHHFLELQIEEGRLVEVRDLWVCKGNRNSLGTKMLIWREAK